MYRFGHEISQSVYRSGLLKVVLLLLIQNICVSINFFTACVTIANKHQVKQINLTKQTISLAKYSVLIRNGILHFELYMVCPKYAFSSIWISTMPKSGKSSVETNICLSILDQILFDFVFYVINSNICHNLLFDG